MGLLRLNLEKGCIVSSRQFQAGDTAQDIESECRIYWVEDGRISIADSMSSKDRPSVERVFSRRFSRERVI